MRTALRLLIGTTSAIAIFMLVVVAFEVIAYNALAPYELYSHPAVDFGRVVLTIGAGLGAFAAALLPARLARRRGKLLA